MGEKLLVFLEVVLVISLKGKREKRGMKNKGGWRNKGGRTGGDYS